MDESMRLQLEQALEIKQLYEHYEKYYSYGIDQFCVKDKQVHSNLVNLTNIDAAIRFKPVKSGYVVCAAYIMRHIKSGKIIPGSTNNINVRTGKNHNDLINGIYRIKEFQDLFNEDKAIEFYFILVNNREDAYDFEQWLIDRFWSTNLLCNKSPCARTNFGIKHSDEIRFKFSKAHRGKKIPKEVIAKRNLTVSHPVMINGIQYPSIKEACRQLKKSPGTILYRLRNPMRKDYQFIG